MEYVPLILKRIIWAIPSVLGIALMISGWLSCEVLGLHQIGFIIVLIGACLAGATIPCIMLLSTMEGIQKILVGHPVQDKPANVKQYWVFCRLKLFVFIGAGIFWIGMGILESVVTKQFGTALINLILGVGFLGTGMQQLLLYGYVKSSPKCLRIGRFATDDEEKAARGASQKASDEASSK